METITDFSFCDGVSHPVRTETRNRQEGDSRWCVNDTGIDYYGKFATEGIPSVYADLLVEHLKDRPKGVVLDVAGGNNGRAARDLMERGLAHRALVTNLEDLRTIDTLKVAQLGHVSGDIIRQDTWEKMERWKEVFAPGGFSAIMYRPYGALENLPLRFYVGGLRTLLNWLGEGGVGLFQIPHFSEPAVCPMVKSRDDIERVFRHDGDDTALVYKR